MREDRFRTIPFKQNRAVIVESTPMIVAEALAQVLRRCQLPPPFKKDQRVTVQQWAQNLNNPQTLFPLITWKIIWTVPAQQTLDPIPTFTETDVSQSGKVNVFQQNFDHLIQFECYAQSQNEASVLQWWLIRKTADYRYNIADAGSQHWRFHESREDNLTQVAAAEYPARSVRFAFTTSMIYRTAQLPLERIYIDTKENIPMEGTEEIVMGEDSLEEAYVDSILSVTSLDGTAYEPIYDSFTRKFVWDAFKVQPNTGDKYIVNYLYYSGLNSTTVVPE